MGRLTTTSLLACLLLGSALPAAADDHGRARQLRESGEILPLQQILTGVPAGQRVLEVELEDEHGAHVYEVEALDPSGAVWEYRFDARSGSLLERRRED